MKKILALFAVISISVTTPALAQDHAPVSSITTATWAQYKGDYQQSPLCGKDEITLWTCETGKRVYSLCSSHEMTRTSGYMQYRASDHGKVVLTYPAEKRTPLGAFVFNSYGSGDASVEFTNNGYGYTLFDALRDVSSIQVLAPSGKRTEIRCGPNQTLQLNYSMRLMHDAGVWEGN
ncbi:MULTISPECIES: hypothetical protein [unclassified Duganella]|uniref:hypothetical protein n=1 Tax=unclassified Duganella TaxID=2636909 RepID=UPI0018F47DBC|nr:MULTISPECIES: hypothetical protein [unclassified Duganella]